MTKTTRKLPRNQCLREIAPSWWTAVALFGVIWAVFLTFVILPIFTLFFGKFYCSHICSCGALAETVGSSFRHRGPKGDNARWVERF